MSLFLVCLVYLVFDFISLIQVKKNYQLGQSKVTFKFNFILENGMNWVWYPVALEQDDNTCLLLNTCHNCDGSNAIRH